MKWNLYFGWQSSRSPSFVIDSRWLELDDDVAVDVVQSTVQWQWAEHWLGTDGTDGSGIIIIIMKSLNIYFLHYNIM